MRRTTGLAGLLLALGGLLLGGCATVEDGYWVSSYPVYSRYVEVNEYRYVNPHGLVVVYDPGVMRYSVVGYPGLYWHDGYYYRHHGTHWQRSSRHGGPWLVHRREPPRIKLNAAESERRFVGKPVEPRRWEGDRGPELRRPPPERFQGFTAENRSARVAAPQTPERQEPDPGRWRGEPVRAPESAGPGPASSRSPAWAQSWDRARPPAVDSDPESPARPQTGRPERPFPVEREDLRQGREGALSATRERPRFAGGAQPIAGAAGSAQGDPRGQGREPGPASRAPEQRTARALVQRPADQASAGGRRWSDQREGEPSPGPQWRAERPAGEPRPALFGRAASPASSEPAP